MANLTISVDAEALRLARMRALERGETVNAYLAQMLRRYADEGRQPEVFAEVAEVAALAGSGARGQDRTWQRDDLHRV